MDKLLLLFRRQERGRLFSADGELTFRFKADCNRELILTGDRCILRYTKLYKNAQIKFHAKETLINFQACEIKFVATDCGLLKSNLTTKNKARIGLR